MNNKLFYLSFFVAFISLQLRAQITETKVDGGKLKGFSKNEIGIFMGIPFAAPPLGDLRWKAPQPAKAWTGVRECVSAPASAMQGKPTPFFCWSKEFLIPDEPINEDCLYLNIWTPAKNKNDKLPVFVWIHGGGFSGGSGTVPLYDGEEFSKKGVVYITINYRLGIFGFFAHPSLSAENPDKVSGNYGILDQIAALQWIQKNVAAFGGDPKNVTIAGQSAGAFSVNALMVSPIAKGLFQKAIAQSGGMFRKELSLVQSFKDGENAGLAFTTKNGNISLKDLRSKPAADLLAMQGRWAPLIDNVVIPDVSQTFEAAKQNDVPLLTGWNSDDGVMFGPALSAEAFKADAEKRYGAKAADFLKAFPASNDEEAKQSQKIAQQLGFGWQNYTWASEQAAKGKNPSYLYYFSHIPPGEPNYGAFHSAEFAYALKTLKYWNRPFTDWDQKLAEMMSSYWVNFAKTGNPNGKDLPNWPAFSGKNPEVIEFGDKVKSENLPFRAQLKFLDLTN